MATDLAPPIFMGDALKRNVLNAKRFALTSFAAAVLSLSASHALALGLGRLAVQSSLGDTLRAEIDITSLTPEEATNLRVRIAPPESYRAAGVDYNAVLPGTQAVLSRRADGRPYLRLTSDRAVQEPFVDVILELTWPAGRLVREYTLLFDPPSNRNTAAAPLPVPAAASPMPSVAASPPPAPIAAAAPMPAAPAQASAASANQAPRAAPPSSAMVRAPAAAPAAALAMKPAPMPPSAAPDAAAEASKSGKAAPNEYKVRAGDSLSRIAAQTQRSGVSLDQMLVSLYRGNPEAFVDNNMNRLKAGVVLAVPSADAAKSVPPVEAKQFIQAQSADFGAYRQRLASGVPEAKLENNARQATGKVQSTVEDKKATAAPAPDKLTLSKGAASAKASAAEEKISKEKQTKDAAERVAELSRNVEALKKISGASAASAAAAAAATTAAAIPKVAEAAKPAALPTAAAPAAPTPAQASAQASAQAPAAPVAVVPLPVPVPAAVSGSAPVPAPVVAAAPPAGAAAAASGPVATVAEGSGLMGRLLEDNSLALAAGGGLLAALLGFGVYKLRRRSKADSGETSFLESRLQPDSFFGASGGQRVDTRDAAGAGSSSMSYSLSQLDAIGDVDPVAEADVYLAYGRDLQAEEILKEAMRSTPERLSIRTKLLEVYAKRRDVKGFESLAIQLFGLTRGEGLDWAHAQELGQQLDPENALYQLGGAPATFNGQDDHVEPLGASTMPQSVLPSASQFGPEAARASASAAAAAAAAASMNMDLDLDLDFSDSVASSASLLTIPASMRTDPFGDSMSFDSQSAPLAKTAVHAVPGSVGAGAGAGSGVAAGAMLGGAASAATAAASVAAVGGVAAGVGDTSGIDKPMTFDLSSISLDFDTPADQSMKKRISPITVPGQSDGAPPKSSGGRDSVHDSLLDSAYDSTHEHADPLLRKLELAEEFRQIGDTDGARDLLREVLDKSNGTLKARAQSLLDQLG